MVEVKNKKAKFLVVMLWWFLIALLVILINSVVERYFGLGVKLFFLDIADKVKVLQFFFTVVLILVVIWMIRKMNFIWKFEELDSGCYIVVNLYGKYMVVKNINTSYRYYIGYEDYQDYFRKLGMFGLFIIDNGKLVRKK